MLYEGNNTPMHLPNRIVFLDGVMQSSRLGKEAYHEALVHPAMFAHPNPERVAIIGGGEGATLREVLKHNTVKVAKMVEIDEEMVYFSKEHLPDWSDCSDLRGSSDWCVDDGRVRMFYEDAVAWFRGRFLKDSANNSSERFDVLIVDAL